MIKISDKSKCCACSACASICPKRCIVMQEDEEGFLYPKVDTSSCIDCDLCRKVCPILHQGAPRLPLEVYAAKNKDEKIRMSSSSGGIFTQLAEKVIDNGGVVFGARFNEKWEVVHDCVENKCAIAAFRGSKYVQSRVGDNFAKVKQLLLSGRKVLFTGTPCQVAGLKKYLGKEYDNLFTVDVVCHGVPSPKVWRIYLREIARKGGKNSVSWHSIHGRDALVKGISFRDKRSGWKKFSFALTLSEATADGEQNTVLLSSVFTENPYMNAFLSNLSLRPSCFSCIAKAGKSCSDIMLGDFWGIEDVLPGFDDDKGCSLVLVYSSKGKELLSKTIHEKWSVPYDDAVRENICVSTSVSLQPNRALFFKLIEKGKGLQNAWTVCSSTQMLHRIRRFIYRKIKI